MYGNRIKKYRKLKGFKTKEFAKIIGISQGGLSGLETGKSKPSADTLSSIVQHTNINPVWLLTGKGEMIHEEALIKKEVGIHPIVARHIEVIREFQQKELALKINWDLLELEKSDPVYLREMKAYIEGKLSGVTKVGDLKESTPKKKKA